MIVAAAALNQTPLDWDNNINNILVAIKRAKKLGVDILCLPELCITGYGCEDAFFYSDVRRRAADALQKIRWHSQLGSMLLSLGLPVMYNNALYNCAALISKDKICGLVAKQNLAADGVHYEPRWFKAWPHGIMQGSGAEFNNAPIGDMIFSFGDNHVKIGYEICEDAWVADRPGVVLAKKGVDIILNPSASHFSFGKHKIREQFVVEGSRAFRCVYVYANLLGNEAGRLIFDGDLMIASGGKLISSSNRLKLNDVDLIVASVDISQNRTTQIQTGSYRPNLDSSNVLHSHLLNFKNSIDEDLTPLGTSGGLRPGAPKEEEFEYAITLGLFDYMRKSHSNGFVVSLSGGADSSVVSSIVRLTHERVLKEIGNCFLEMPKLLTCIYQGTQNSSDETLKAAEHLARSIEADFKSIDIDYIVKTYHELSESIIGRKLNWQQDDIALQNIQARVRGPSVWMIANIKGALLLSTSNRSEAAVGYATADGDTCGGLSPIAGIDKHFLLHWLEWLSKRSPFWKDALKYVVALKPTAELRPKESNQTDEDDLMPYWVLDVIERAAIRDKKSPKEVYDLLLASGSRFSEAATTPAQAAVWVKRFFNLWSRNQWKREKLPLSIHLDDHNLDPKSWCRFPILSGSFTKELEEIPNV